MKIRVENLDESLTTKFVNFCCEELQISPNYIEVVGDDWEGDNTGLCVDLDEKDFLVVVSTKDRNLTQIYTTIAHELIHVKQHMKDGLGSLLDAKNKPPYTQRWWEKEAREKSSDFVKKFVDILEQTS